MADVFAADEMHTEILKHAQVIIALLRKSTLPGAAEDVRAAEQLSESSPTRGLLDHRSGMYRLMEACLGLCRKGLDDPEFDQDVVVPFVRAVLSFLKREIARFKAARYHARMAYYALGSMAHTPSFSEVNQGMMETQVGQIETLCDLLQKGHVSVLLDTALHFTKMSIKVFHLELGEMSMCSYFATCGTRQPLECSGI